MAWLKEATHPDSPLWWWVLGFGVTMWLHAQFFRKDEEPEDSGDS